MRLNLMVGNIKKSIVCLLMCILVACSSDISYTRISPKEAQSMMEEMEHFILIDVRTKEEFQESHIEGAINIPLDAIDETVSSILKDKNQTIFVYCRSGNRSQDGSQKLVELGYTNVIEMGGIIDWEGNIVKEGT